MGQAAEGERARCSQSMLSGLEVLESRIRRWGVLGGTLSGGRAKVSHQGPWAPNTGL